MGWGNVEGERCLAVSAAHFMTSPDCPPQVSASFEITFQKEEDDVIIAGSNTFFTHETTDLPTNFNKRKQNTSHA